MRIAIANDMLIAVEVLRRLVVKVPNYKLAWIAYDGVQAVSMCAADTPDLILMDVLMPSMDGVEATRHIMRESPCAIVMVTASINRYAAQVLEAMTYGALDAINIPDFGDGNGLLHKIATIARLIGKSSYQRFHPAPYPKSLPPLVVIGASTGGPQALLVILSQFPQDFPAAVVIVQHLDAQFTQGFANWLNEQISLPVKLATPDSSPQAGKVLLAGTNHHLVMRSDLTLTYDKQSQDCFYQPSIDIFFASVAQHWTGKGVGVLLTGMGRDGAQGLKQLRQVGWHTIAQDRQTSVVYGMPKVASELNAAMEVLPIGAIASACIQFLSNSKLSG